MKLWQCSQCRELTEDCKMQCFAITDDDVIPENNCLRDEYIQKKEDIEDDERENGWDGEDNIIDLSGIARWVPIEKGDLPDLE